MTSSRGVAHSDVRYRIHHMLLSTRGLRWRKVLVVPITVYIDDSGTSPSQHVAIASAVIIPAARILKLENELDKLKRREGFTDFHTSEFICRNYKSQYGKWDDVKHLRVFERVRAMTRKYVSQGFTFAVNKADYEAIIPSEIRKYVGTYHYTWAIRHVLTFVDGWRKAAGIEDPCEFVFDFMKPNDENRKEIEDVMEQAEEESLRKGGFTGTFVNYGFRRRTDIAGLQCADLVAWTNYQFALEKFRNTPLHPLAKVAWDDFAKMPTTAYKSVANRLEWNFSVAIKPKALKEWVAKEMAEGTSFRLHKEFEQKKQREKESRLESKKK